MSEHERHVIKGFHDRVSTASALATGTEGPVRVALHRLRRYGIGERVIKSALAAGVAWLIAASIHDDPLPVLAPITALFTIQLTLARSITGSAQRLLGVVAGVSMAIVLSRMIGLEWWVVGLIVLVTLTTGFRVFRLESAGVEQMTVSALLVAIAGASGNILAVAGYHILDTIIGTTVGLAANSLIAPPSHVPGARLAVQALGARLIGVLDDLAAALGDGIDEQRAEEILVRARTLASEVDEVQIALDRAEESLKFNLPGRLQKPGLSRYRRANLALDHAAIQTRVLARTVLDCARTGRREAQEPPAWITPATLGAPLADLISSLALYLEAFLVLPDRPEEASAMRPLRDEVAGRRRAVSDATAARFAELQPDRWVLIGEIVSISDQFVADLTQATADLTSSGSPVTPAPRYPRQP